MTLPQGREEVSGVRLAMRERRAVIAATVGRYQRSGKREKGKILDEFTLLTGYERSYARYVLRTWGKKVYAKGRTYVAGSIRKKRPVREPVYDGRVAAVLKEVWKIMDYICGKRLRPV